MTAGSNDRSGVGESASDALKMLRWAWAEIDLGAIRHNTQLLAGRAAPGELCVVVKANGYGHGAVPVARAAIEAGASWLGVALVHEGVELREAGIASPVLILSEPPPHLFGACAEWGLTPAVYTSGGVEAAVANRVASAHIKVDTGMHRVGANPDDVSGLVSLAEHLGLEISGIFTHLANADDATGSTNKVQLDAFARVNDIGQHRHVANSAALLNALSPGMTLARVGIAAYGIVPSESMKVDVPNLRPALSLKARVSMVKRVGAGAGVSYGHRFVTKRPSTLATIPIGYADGVPRRLGSVGGVVLIGGMRCPIAGVVTMDQLVVDAGDLDVAVGDEVVLIGRQRSEEIDAYDWANRLDTIAYEVVCGISARVPRVYVVPMGRHGTRAS